MSDTDDELKYAKYCKVNPNWASRDIVRLLRDKESLQQQLDACKEDVKSWQRVHRAEYEKREALDTEIAELRAENARLREALQIISNQKQSVDNTYSDKKIAELALGGDDE